jgi:hypothetical protein
MAQVLGRAALMSARAESSSPSMARSPMETMPTAGEEADPGGRRPAGGAPRGRRRRDLLAWTEQRPWRAGGGRDRAVRLRGPAIAAGKELGRVGGADGRREPGDRRLDHLGTPGRRTPERFHSATRTSAIPRAFATDWRARLSPPPTPVVLSMSACTSPPRRSRQRIGWLCALQDLGCRALLRGCRPGGHQRLAVVYRLLRQLPVVAQVDGGNSSAHAADRAPWHCSRPPLKTTHRCEHGASPGIANAAA